MMRKEFNIFLGKDVIILMSACLCTTCRHAVTDMAWTPDGMTLLACSGDGTIAVLMFSKEEFGIPLAQVHSSSAMSCA